LDTDAWDYASSRATVQTGKTGRSHGDARDETWCDGTMCDHQGFHSGEGRYDEASRTLRYVLVCDACRAELRIVSVERYSPSYDPHGNDAYLRAA
jgi:hypothetical protein